MQDWQQSEWFKEWESSARKQIIKVKLGYWIYYFDNNIIRYIYIYE